MSLIILNVDEVRRTLSASGGAFVVHDKEVDIVRFAINSGFADIVLDGQVALRVMYQRPGETQVRAQTLTYYDTDGLRNYYDWQLLSADLAKKGTLTVALCILRTDSEVEEWHTTPYQIRVLGSIHTDDSDEADETITPTVVQRVAVLETMIQRVASGAPIVVASVSAMTDTEQIYVLSTDGTWYYHNGSAWVAGGEYGGVAAGSITTDKLADEAVTEAKLSSDIKSAVKTITGNSTIQYSDPQKRQYIATNGTTVQWDTPSVSGSAQIKWAVVPCSAGDEFIVNGRGGSADRLWAFADANKNVLDPRANPNAVAENLTIVAPTGAAYLILNSETPDSISYTGGRFLVDLVNSGMVQRNVLTSGADLNTLKTSGIYYCTSSSLPNNVPENDGGIVLVFANGENWVKQEYATKSACYERTIIGNTVGDWSEIYGSGYKAKGLNSANDLNDVTGTGLYYWSTGGNYAPLNAPISGVYGLMIVFSTPSVFLGQVAIGETYFSYRTKNASGWTNWVDILTYATDAGKNFAVEALKSDNVDIIKISNPSLKQYINLTTTTSVDFDHPSVGSSSCGWGYLECDPGDVFVINGKGGASNRLFGFLDAEKNIISTSAAGVDLSDYYIVAPQNAKYIVVNNEYSLGSNPISRRLNKQGFVNVKFIDLLRYTGTVYNDMETGKASWTKGGQSEDVPVTGSSVVYVTARPDASAYVTFMSSPGIPVYYHSEYKLVDVPEGGPNRIEIGAGQTRRIETPNGAEYMNVLRWGNDEVLHEPENICIIYGASGNSAYYDVLRRDTKRDEITDVMYKKMVQLRDLEWDPLGIVYSISNGILAHEGKRVLHGIPYSSVKEKDKFLGFEVSFITFMSAAANRYSLLYTEKCGGTDKHSAYGITYYGGNCGSYFGQVCNVFALNSVGIQIPYNSDEFLYLWKTGLFDVETDQSAYGACVGDVLWVPHHAALVTDVKRDKAGKLLYVEVSESNSAWSSTTRLDAEDFDIFMGQNGGGTMYRYNEKYKNVFYKQIPFIQLWGEEPDTTYTINNDICTYAGDYASFFGGHSDDNPQEPIFINCNLGETRYTTLKVYKINYLKWRQIGSETPWRPIESERTSLVGTFSLSTMGNHHEIMINGNATRDSDGNIISTTVNNPLEAGRYIAVLTNGDMESAPTHFEVVDTHVTVFAAEDHDTYEISYSSSNGRPLYVQTVNVNGSSLGIRALTQDEIKAGKIVYHPKALYDEQYAINYYGVRDGDVIPEGYQYGTSITPFPTQNGAPDYSAVYCKVFFVGEYGTVRNDPIPFGV